MSELVVTQDVGEGPTGLVRVITFNRPEVLNAFNTSLYQAAAAALDEARTDERVSVAVLTGAGRAFSSGQDLKEMAALTAESQGHGFPTFIDALAAFDKPLVAAVNGLGLGIGMTMLAWCDLVIVDENATLRTPFAELGVAPEAASSLLFPMILGRQQAARVLLGGAWLSAAEAVQHGLAAEVAAPGTALERGVEQALALAAAPLASLRAIKNAMWAPLRDGIVTTRRREDAAFQQLLGL
jgi:enoyl-CoA hydratase/carnithine racemase